jgi:hypothetical protein
MALLFNSGDVDGLDGINNMDVIKLVYLVNNEGGDGYTVGKCQNSNFDINSTNQGIHPNTMLIKNSNSYKNGEQGVTLGTAPGAGQTSKPNGYSSPYYSFALDGYVDHLCDMNKVDGWPNNADIIQLVNWLTSNFNTDYDPANRIHPTNPLSITPTNNTISIKFRRTLKTHDDADGSDVITGNETDPFYGGVRLTDFQLHTSSNMDDTTPGNPSLLAFSTTTETNDTLTLTFDTLPTGASNNKYWLKFIPRRDSDNLGISLTYNNFVFEERMLFVKEGVFIYGFTGGGSEGLELTLTQSSAVAMTVTVVDGKYVITDANNTAFTRSISLLHKTFEFDFTSAPGFQITDSNGDLNGTVVENKQTITVNSRTPTLYFSDSTNANTTGGVIYILPPWLGPPSQDQ